MRIVISLVAGVSVLAAGLSVLGMRLWEAASGAVISLHGYIALGLGSLFTFGLTAGLMALVFYSSRRGYDDGAGMAEDLDDRVC